MDTKGRYLELKYMWSVRGGEITSGHGTIKVEIKKIGDEVLSTTIKIKGFRPRCEHTFTESQAIYAPPQEAVKLDEFEGPLVDIADERFEKLVETARSRHDLQLYIIVGTGKDSPLKRAVIEDSTLTTP